MSTYYTAGGMPLAFTQEDFLVLSNKIDVVSPSVSIPSRSPQNWLK